MGKIVPISLNLYFNPNTVACYGYIDLRTPHLRSPVTITNNLRISSETTRLSVDLS